MAVTIKLKNASGSDPSASDLVLGELAVRTDNGKIFLKKDDGSVAEVSGGGIDDGDKGDITVSNSGATFTIDSGVISTAKIADDAITAAKLNDNSVVNAALDTLAQNRIKGRVSSGTGNVEDLTAANVRTIINVEDGATADQTKSDIDALGIAASTATTLATARTIGGTSFDGSANITPANATTSVNVTGTVGSSATGTTQSAGDNSTKIATTAYTDTAISNLINGAPAALDTLNELAAAMNDDAAFSTTVTNSLATKLPLAGGQITGNITCSGSQTFDGRDLSVDGSKLDGIESGATADQSASEILTLIKTVDGSGSGLDADLLDGASTDVDASGNSIVKRHSSGYIYATYFNTSPNDISDGSITKLCAESGDDGWIRHAGAAAVRTFLNVENGATADQTASEILTLIKTVDGAGSGLDADTLDGISSGNFLRSNTADSMGAKLTLNQSNDDEKLILAGTSNPYIRFQESTTNKAYIQWHSSGYIRLQNQEDASILRIKDDIDFSSDDGSTYHSLYHEGNLSVGDGGLTQNNFTNTLKSKLDGIAASATNVTNNNQLTNGAGYITAMRTQEEIEDFVGNMVTGNTETGITVTYQDSDGTLDFVVASQTDNNFTTTLKNKLDGIAASATNVTNNNQLTNGAGYTTYTANQAVNTGSQPTFLDVYTNGWFRNNQQGEGLYNTANGMHWYSGAAGYFDIGGGQSGQGIRCRDNHNGTLRGYFYYDNSNRIGILDGDGNWAVRVDKDVSVDFRVNSTVELTVLPDTVRCEGAFFENAQAVAADKTISDGYNAMSAGPITVNNSVTVTVGSGEVWTII